MLDTSPQQRASDAGRPFTHRQNIAKCVLLALGLSFLWALIRHASISGLIGFIGLDSTKSEMSLCYYALLAAFGGLVAFVVQQKSLFGSTAAQKGCIALGLVSSGCVVTSGAVLPFAGLESPSWFQWTSLVITAFAAGALIIESIALCTSLASTDKQLLLICALGSVLTSIVETFIFSDILLLGDSIAGWYPALSACLLYFGGPAENVEPPSGVGIKRIWPHAQVLVLIGLLILVTLMKALSDAAYAGSNLRMTKHMIGLLEIMLVLAMAATVRQAGAQTRAAYYTLVGSALVGIALTCAPLPEGLIHMGVATLATVRVLTEALVLVYVAELAAYNHRLFAKAALLYFILPEMVTCVVGYGMLPELFQDMSAGAGVVLQRVGILAMACLGIGFLSAYGLHDVKAMGLNAKNAQTSLEAPSESADSSCSQEIALSLAKRFSLTDREATMIGYLYQGHSAKSISSKECISVNTVQTHSRNLYRKLGIHSRHELVQLVDSFERLPQKSDLGPF